MWNKFKEGFRKGFQSVTLASLFDVLIAIGALYIVAWLVGEPVDDVVGWFALGIAAARGNR
jgi:uncharacterized membrane protein YbhN (UPF0104 family)